MINKLTCVHLGNTKCRCSFSQHICAAEQLIMLQIALLVAKHYFIKQYLKKRRKKKEKNPCHSPNQSASAYFPFSDFGSLVSYFLFKFASVKISGVSITEMSLIWIFILFHQIIYSAEAVDPHELSFVSVDSGKTVSLICKLGNAGQSSKFWFWYRQRAGHELQEVAMKLAHRDPTKISDRFKIKENFSLTIKNATKDDEGMYFCGSMEKSILFSNGTFLAVKGHPQLNISVIQTPVSVMVPPGQPVNLQCSVYPENQSAELRVFWFRSAAGSSSPEIIHTHNFSRSSRQCVYNFSKIITDENDTGTFYCAVTTCGRIIIGSGTPVNLKGPADLIVLYLGAALGLCVFVIIVLSVSIFNVRPQQDSLYENVASQDTVELIMKKRCSGDSVYSEVSYFTVDDANQTG